MFRVIYVTCGVHKIIDGSIQCGRVEIVKQEKLLFTGCLRKYLWRFRYPLVVVLWVQMCMYIGRDCLLSSLARNHALQCTTYYFPEGQLPCRMNRGPRIDDGSNGLIGEQISIFNYPGRPRGKKKLIWQKDEDYNASRLYILRNCPEVGTYLK